MLSWALLVSNTVMSKVAGNFRILTGQKEPDEKSFELYIHKFTINYSAYDKSTYSRPSSWYRLLIDRCSFLIWCI